MNHKYHKGSSDELLGVCIEGNGLKIILSSPYVYVSQTKVNDMKFDTFMKIPFK